MENTNSVTELSKDSFGKMPKVVLVVSSRFAFISHLVVVPSGLWKLEGNFKQTSYAQAGYCFFEFDADASSFKGTWTFGDKNGEWHGVKVRFPVPLL
jgi:hypothetical protein